MAREPRLFKRKTNGVYYVVFYAGPVGTTRYRESLKTRDRTIAELRMQRWLEAK